MGWSWIDQINQLILFDQEKRSSEPLAPEQFLSAFFLLMLGVVIATGKTQINLNHIEGGHIGPKWETKNYIVYFMYNK